MNTGSRKLMAALAATVALTALVLNTGKVHAAISDAVLQFRDTSVGLGSSFVNLNTSNSRTAPTWLMANVTLSNSSGSIRNTECQLLSSLTGALDTGRLTLPANSLGTMTLQILKPSSGSPEIMRFACKGDGGSGVSVLRSKMLLLEVRSTSFLVN